MCGIAGVVGQADPALAQSLTAALDPRGPDGRGYWHSGNISLGATRLSIIDPGAGTELIRNETGTICVVLNGEIYNHRSLRAQLEQKGHRFKTRTDTEVIVHLYEDTGDDCVQYLQGMFAFAIADGNRVFLARDRLGIKPLYFTRLPNSGALLFASEIKALLQCPAVVPSLDLQAFADSLILGHPVGTRTFIQDINSLAPGHTMTVSCDRLGVETTRQKAYYRPVSARNGSLSFDDAAEGLNNTLTRAVESHLAADVPVGLTLSGGIDSTILAFLASETANGPLLTFTVSDHAGHPDALQAASVASMIGSEHHSFVLGFEEYLDALPGYIAAEERPSRAYGIPFYLLCRKLSEYIRVCLHGEGADELFGGYSEYLDPTHRTRYIARRLPLLKDLGITPSDRLLEIIERLFKPADDEESLQTLLDFNLSDPLERHHLDPVDKAAMASGVEMRVPYLDDDLVELVTRFPVDFLVRRDLGIRKYILRRICLQRFGCKALDTVLRGKLGVPSAGAFFLRRFDDLCERVLPSDYRARHTLGEYFESNRELVVYELFEQIFLKHRGNAANVASPLAFLNERSGKTVSEFAALAEIQ